MSHLNSASFSPSIGSANSNNSFNLMDVLDPKESQLLSPSISLDSLWSTNSDEPVPPFPERPAVRVVPMLLDDRCMLYPFGRGKKGPDLFKVLTSIATPPRMKNLLLEPLCIEKWVETVYMRAPPPSHLAWEPPAVVKESTWVPSGSMFSPGDFKHALRLARSAFRETFVPFSMFNSILPKTPRSLSPGSNRKALVFEHEITLNTEGQTKRWPLQVPAETMNPEMVDIMLELQDLNSFFKDSLAGLDESVAVIEKEKSKLSSEPPALIVSDSHRCFPLPTESPERDAPVPIAARRGRRLLPPLALAPKVEMDPYPSIPTAFLGSPSAYSPKFECGTGNSPSLDLEHMVTNLRSQCAFPRAVGGLVSESPANSPVSDISFAAPSDQASLSDDDWAFAVSFLDEYGGQAAELDTQMTKPVIHGDLEPNGDISSNEFLTSTRATSPSPVPSTPLPPLPSPTPRDTVSPSPRGILKSSKNVRFATLPERSWVQNEQEDPSTPPAAPPLPQPPKAPARVIAYTRDSKQLTAISPPDDIPEPASSKKKKSGDRRPASAFPVSPGYSQNNKPGAFSVHRSPTRPQSAVPSGRNATPSLPGRQPLGNLASPNENKESKDPSTSAAKAGLRWTMNDMTFRRGSPSSQGIQDGGPKSRMPVPGPLRSILTRFK